MTFDFIRPLGGERKSWKNRGKKIVKSLLVVEERYLCTEVNDIKEEENDKFQVYFRLSYCIVDVV